MSCMCPYEHAALLFCLLARLGVLFADATMAGGQAATGSPTVGMSTAAGNGTASTRRHRPMQFSAAASLALQQQTLPTHGVDESGYDASGGGIDAPTATSPTMAQQQQQQQQLQLQQQQQLPHHHLSLQTTLALQQQLAKLQQLHSEVISPQAAYSPRAVPSPTAASGSVSPSGAVSGPRDGVVLTGRRSSGTGGVFTGGVAPAPTNSSPTSVTGSASSLVLSLSLSPSPPHRSLPPTAPTTITSPVSPAAASSWSSLQQQSSSSLTGPASAYPSGAVGALPPPPPVLPAAGSALGTGYPVGADAAASPLAPSPQKRSLFVADTVFQPSPGPSARETSFAVSSPDADASRSDLDASFDSAGGDRWGLDKHFRGGASDNSDDDE